MLLPPVLMGNYTTYMPHACMREAIRSRLRLSLPLLWAILPLPLRCCGRISAERIFCSDMPKAIRAKRLYQSAQAGICCLTCLIHRKLRLSPPLLQQTLQLTNAVTGKSTSTARRQREGVNTLRAPFAYSVGGSAPASWPGEGADALGIPARRSPLRTQEI